MAHHKVTQDQAFAMLRSSSQSLHRKLRDVAGEVVETGTLPSLA
jgi:AmiR/NasT family two-component response regulator